MFLLAIVPRAFESLADRFRGTEDGNHQPRESSFKVIKPQIVQMDVAGNIHAKQARVNHGLKVMRHARLRPSQAERTTGEIPFSRQHSHELQPHGIAEGMEHFCQVQILRPRVGNNLHF